jgi:dephospho-CoA kinase
MTVIGITGGIGSGKSVVSRLLEMNGIPVYDTDRAAKTLYDTNDDIRRSLIDRFGPALYEPHGRLNRPMLAALIFNHPEQRDFVNARVHPAVEKDFSEWIDRQPQPIVAVESALLFECELKQRIDLSINVSAPIETRIRRIQARDGLDRAAILARIRNQMSDEKRCARADHTFVNDDRQALLPQVENWLKTLKSE